MSFRIQNLIKSEAYLGKLLILSLFLAVIVSNSPLYHYYLKLVYLPISLQIGALKTQVTFISLVNDGLMALFFLLIGLEMKYHLIEGEYRVKKKLFLPVAAAIGGLLIPALGYVMFNFNEETLRGWAIPIATDTAFVLGILSFYNKKISVELRTFILGFSLIDDALAIIILALVYTSSVNVVALWLTAICILLLGLLNYFHVKKLSSYLGLGLLLWLFIVESGIHGTLAGIILALFIPVNVKVNQDSYSPLKKLEHGLTPLVNCCLLPMFAFINSEIPLKEITWDNLTSPLSLGILTGLFLGKPLGIIGFSYFAVKTKLSQLPVQTSWPQYYGVSILAGIGFTLSLFIGNISFSDPAILNDVRISVILASILAAIGGSLVLKYSK